MNGYQQPIPASVLLRRPDLKYKPSNLRFVTANSVYEEFVSLTRSPHSELYATVQLWADSKPLTVPVQTAYKVFKTARIWNEWLTLPISYANVPQNALLAITLWDLSPAAGDDTPFHAVPFGGTTIPLFDKDNTLFKGKQRCRVHRNVVADGLSNTTTPHVLQTRHRDENGKVHEQHLTERETELERLETLMKKFEMGEMPEDKWLDNMVFRQIEKLERQNVRDSVQKRASNLAQTNGGGAHKTAEDYIEDEGIFNLYIELPRFDHPIVFTDHEYPAPPVSTMNISSSDIRLRPPPDVTLGPGINADGFDDPTAGRLIRIYDPEVGVRENPVEMKHRKLVRLQRTDPLDRDLKPNAKVRDELNNIMSYGPTQELKEEEKDLVWKFRHYLSRDKRALTKYVKSTDWKSEAEVRLLVQMLPKWTEIDVDDALELLGPTVDNPTVRAYAVERLRKADDEELLLYLLQLVQALKFEPVQPQTEDVSAAEDSSLARFLVTRAADSFLLGNYLHWYLMVECSDNSPQQEPVHRKLFAKVEYDFMTELMNRPDGPQHRKTLRRQAELVTILSKISKDVRHSRDDRPKKIEKLKKYIADPKNELLEFDGPLPLPLDPSVQITGCVPEQSNVFKSSLFPLLVTFKTTTGSTYPVIFKTGDDLRQDQLVIQIINLMDRLLRKENLDLKLTPYHILATSPITGGVQFVASSSVSAACAKHKTILNYLRHHNPDSSAPLGVRRQAMETYVKSVAGYCVITFLLGVGDRHSDNLLLAPDGRFFHADFGYILGRDPKPFAPLFKLDHQIVEGMGGPQHDYYAQFKQYCFTAYTALRKNANLILNLFALMSRANIPDIRLEPDKATLKVLERFHLEMSEGEAIRYFEQVTTDMVSAVMPQVIDRLHGFVQGWRA